MIEFVEAFRLALNLIITLDANILEIVLLSLKVSLVALIVACLIGFSLGSILALASIEETLTRAVILLIFYSLGLAIPFVLSGYLIQRFLLFSKNFKKNINLISKIGGIILLVTGILILTNQLQAIGFYIIEIFPFMQKFG